MSYDEFETSTEGGAPVELYEIRIGEEDPIYYTSSSFPLIVEGTSYFPVPGLKRSKTEDGPQKRKNEFQVELPSSDPVVIRFGGIIPGKRVRLIVKRFHRTDVPDPEVRTIFIGYVESIKLTKNGHHATLSARPELSAGSQTCPREGYQTQCNNVLYDARCTVDSTDPRFRALNVAVDAANGRTLTVSAAESFPDGWFTAGRASIDNDTDHRLILSHTGTEIVLQLPFPADPVQVTLYAGCDHTPTTCALKFENVSDGGLNYRGFYFVPKRNIFRDGVLVVSNLDGITL